MKTVIEILDKTLIITDSYDEFYEWHEEKEIFFPSFEALSLDFLMWLMW